MGQSSYADWFVNGILSWIRSIASGVASIFQSESSSASSGNTLLTWFASHWITLLITLVVVGLLMDWIVWMVRWRPYWLWFRKKRLLLEDDIDIDLSDEELERRFGPLGPNTNRKPHFHQGAALGRAGRPIYVEDEVAPLYGDEDTLSEDTDYEDPDIEDPFDGDSLLAYEDYANRYGDEAEDEDDEDDEDDDYINPRHRFREDLRAYDDSFDDIYDEGDEEEYDDEDYDEDGYEQDEYRDSDYDDEEYEEYVEDGEGDEDDSAQKNFRNRKRFINNVPRRLNLFSGLRRKKAVDPYDLDPYDEEDPFSVDDVAQDLQSSDDDDFFSVIKDVPELGPIEQKISPVVEDPEISEPPVPELSKEQQQPPVYDWRTGYSGKNPTINTQPQAVSEVFTQDPSEQPPQRTGRRRKKTPETLSANPEDCLEQLPADSRRARRRVREMSANESKFIEDKQSDDE